MYVYTVEFTYGEFALAKFRISGRKSSSPDFPPIEINVNMVRICGILVSENNAYVEGLLCSICVIISRKRNKDLHLEPTPSVNHLNLVIESSSPYIKGRHTT